MYARQILYYWTTSLGQDRVIANTTKIMLPKKEFSKSEILEAITFKFSEALIVIVMNLHL